MTTTVPATTREPVDYDIARTLQRLATAITDAGTTPAQVDIIVQYPPGDTASVDDLARECAAPLPQHEQMVSGSWHYTSRHAADPMRLTVFAAHEPASAKRDRLRRELAELDAQIGAGT